MAKANNKLRHKLNQKKQRHFDGSIELWRDVPGYEGYYRVSDRGRVKSVSRNVYAGKGSYKKLAGSLKKLTILTNGYAVVQLYKNNKRNMPYVHNLVLESFVGPKPSWCDECRHFPDGSKVNNNLANLSWGTYQEQAEDKASHGTNGAKDPIRLKCKACGCVFYRSSWKAGQKYCSQACYQSCPKSDESKRKRSETLIAMYQNGWRS